MKFILRSSGISVRTDVGYFLTATEADVKQNRANTKIRTILALCQTTVSNVVANKKKVFGVENEGLANKVLIRGVV